LQRVVINLLRTQDQPDAQGRAGVLLEVCDSGAGLSAPVQAQLFRPFFTTKTEGNGLGLWISLELVERYGGHLHGANRRERGEDTKGAVFSLWLLCEPVAQEVGANRVGG
jgi:two-component system NtrC family sensor kinase